MLPADLLKIGRSIVEKTRNALFIGSSNIHDDNLRTAGWTHTLLNSQRQKIEWRKKDNKWETQEIRGHLLNGGTFSVDSLGQNALYGAHAYMSKSGNCGEMTNVSLYYLSLFLKDHDFEKEKVEIASMALPDPYNHVLVKMTVKGTPDQTLYIDPWMGISYLEKDFAENIALTTAKLIQEEGLAQEIEVQDTRFRSNAVEGSESLPLRVRLTPASLLQMELINSSASCAYYVKIFEMETHKEATAEASSYFSTLLKKAIHNREYHIISTVIAQGAHVDDEIIRMAFLTEHVKVIEKIQEHLTDSDKLKCMYFQRELESADNVPNFEDRMIRTKSLIKQILTYQQEQLIKKDGLLGKVDKKQHPEIKKFYETLLKNSSEIIRMTTQYIESQKVLKISQENTTKPLSQIISRYQNTLDHRTAHHEKDGVVNPNRTYQINFLKLMQAQIAHRMTNVLLPERLNERQGRDIVLGALWVLKAQLKEKGQKGITNSSSLESEINDTLRGLLPKGTNINKPDPASIHQCFIEMNKVPSSLLEESFGSHEKTDVEKYWKRINTVAEELNESLKPFRETDSKRDELQSGGHLSL